MVPGPDLLRPQSGEDVLVGSSIQFLSSARCNHLFGIHDPYGIHNTWLTLSSLVLTSSRTTTSKTFSAASHVKPVISRLLRG